MTIDITRSIALKISAFCDGGRGGDFREKVFKTSLQNATANRMGRMVNVYMKESRQTMNPKKNIYQQY